MAPGRSLSIRASYGLTQEVVAALHPRLDEVILNTMGQVGEQVALACRARPPRGRSASASPRSWRCRSPTIPPKPSASFTSSATPRARFSPADRDVLDVFARQAATTIQQARLAAAVLTERQPIQTMQSSFVSIVSHELQTPA